MRFGLPANNVQQLDRNLLKQIAPCRIRRLNLPQLPRAIPFLHLPFTRESGFARVMLLPEQHLSDETASQ